MGVLSELPGLGVKSEQALNDIGVYSVEDLKQLGAISTFRKLQAQSTKAVSLNFLYALVGAIEGRDWRSVAKTERTRLIFELEDAQKLDAMEHHVIGEKN